MTIFEETQAALEEAADTLTPRDRGTVAALLELARKLDAQVAGEAKPDFVSFPTFLKFAEALYLTPASREKLKPEEAKPVGSIDELKAKRAWRSA